MWWTVAKEAAANWSSHKDAKQGAAIAYYSVFSLGPIIVIAIAVAGLLFGRETVTTEVITSIKGRRGCPLRACLRSSSTTIRVGLVGHTRSGPTLRTIQPNGS